MKNGFVCFEGGGKGSKHPENMKSESPCFKPLLALLPTDTLFKIFLHSFVSVLKNIGALFLFSYI